MNTRKGREKAQEEIMSNLITQNLRLRTQLKKFDLVLLKEPCKFALGAWVSFVLGGNVVVGRVLRVHTVVDEYMYTIVVNGNEVVTAESTLVGTSHVFDVFEEVSFNHGGKELIGTVKKRVVTLKTIRGVVVPKVAYHITHKDSGGGNRVTVVDADEGNLQYVQ